MEYLNADNTAANHYQHQQLPQATLNPQLQAQLKKGTPLLNKYQAALRATCLRLEIFDEDFKSRNQRNPIHHISSRLKSPQSIYEKMVRYDLPVSVETVSSSIFDVAGIRVVCHYVDDVYAIFESISEQDDLEIIRVRDYIANPKTNGYRSLHLVVGIPVNFIDHKEYVPVEIQLRTLAMDLWASLEHDLCYKKEQPARELNDFDITQELLECSDVLADVEQRMQRISQMMEKNRLES